MMINRRYMKVSKVMGLAAEVWGLELVDDLVICQMLSVVDISDPQKPGDTTGFWATHDPNGMMLCCVAQIQ